MLATVCGAGVACLSSSSPRTLVLLAKAATLGTLSYCVVVSIACQKCAEGGAAAIGLMCTLMGALAGVALPNRAFGLLARGLLPQAVLDVVAEDGVLSGAGARGWQVVCPGQLALRRMACRSETLTSLCAPCASMTSLSCGSLLAAGRLLPDSWGAGARMSLGLAGTLPPLGHALRQRLQALRCCGCIMPGSR